MANGVVFERNDLYRLMWTEPATHIAKRLGVSPAALYRACDRLSVPRPTSGHWARVALGAEPERPPLPERNANERTTFEVTPPTVRSIHLTKARAEPPIVVPEKVKQLHPLLRSRDDEKGAMVAIHVTAELRDRAVRVLHTILVELDQRSLKYRPAKAQHIDGSRRRGRVVVNIAGIDVSIVLSEWIHPVDVEAPKGKPWQTRADRGDGRLRLHVYTSNWWKPQRSWRDEGGRLVEQYLNPFFTSLYTAADHERARRESFDAAARQREADQEARRCEAQRAEMFNKLIADAQQRVANITFASNLRELADRVEQGPAKHRSAWASWARQLAARCEHDVIAGVPDVAI